MVYKSRKIRPVKTLIRVRIEDQQCLQDLVTQSIFQTATPREAKLNADPTSLHLQNNTSPPMIPDTTTLAQWRL